MSAGLPEFKLRLLAYISIPSEFREVQFLGNSLQERTLPGLLLWHANGWQFSLAVNDI